MQQAVRLPVPAESQTPPAPERLADHVEVDGFLLSPRSLISITFSLNPQIKSSYERFKSEEARYDFFVVSRDSLTPNVRTRNAFLERRDQFDIDRGRTDRIVTRDRGHIVEAGVEKRFFDTSELDFAVGYESREFDNQIGNHPYVSAQMRYPLWVSRQKLERTSEDIFRRNELDDAQLAYIDDVRNAIQAALFKFHEVVQLRSRVGHTRSRRDDLQAVLDRIDEIQGGNNAADQARLQAEVARNSADLRVFSGRYDIDIARLKSVSGVPFFAEVEVLDEPFNPFAGMDHRSVLLASIETDPEIATLHNSVKNAEVQLDLARRGKWDLTLLLDGRSSLEGRGTEDGDSAWSVSVGMDVSAVDPRVTNSLIRQAQANIYRFKQAIASRENEIFVDTLEPLVRLETLGQSRDELIRTLPQFRRDYEDGMRRYLLGDLSVDDLITRRNNLFLQEEEIANLTFLLGANVAELLSATGKAFELLDHP